MGGAHRQPGDHHALYQLVGIRLHQQAIGKRAGVALIGVTHNVFLRGRCIQHRLPFDARRKGRATATAQTGFRHRVHDALGCQLQSPLQTGKALQRR